jgi:peptidoglycan/LPS O-acetylase OafA/YrhL
VSETRLSTSQPRLHFAGLDGLRGIAALFVVLDHILLSQESQALPHPNWGVWSYRGGQAVLLFFTLSGFLITYLLLVERARTGTVDVGAFYLRRVCRIWPLYFAVVAFGLVFYTVLVPRLGFSRPVPYEIPAAIALYALFLPNLMSTLYSVGGILNPLWSIGIEEQFYLVWAPVARRWAGRLRAICWTVLVVFLAIALAWCFKVFPEGPVAKFFELLKFHFIAAGALAGIAFHDRRQRLLARPWFRSTPVALALTAVLVDFYTLHLLNLPPWASEVEQLVLYPWLLVAVASSPRASRWLELRPFRFLGRVSYGVYLLHMPAVYAVTLLFARTTWWQGRLAAYVVGYYTLALALVLALAAVSYRWFESPFLRLKTRYAAVGTG